LCYKNIKAYGGNFKGAGLQLVLYLIFSSVISFLLYKVGVTDNGIVAFLIMIISTIFTVKLTGIFYKKKLKKKNENIDKPFRN
jgi:hypothetical protein